MQPPTATLLDAPRSPVAGSQPRAGRPAEPVVTPAAPHLKFSAVLGTTSANSSIFMRPTSCRDSSRLSPLPHTPPQRSCRPPRPAAPSHATAGAAKETGNGPEGAATASWFARPGEGEPEGRHCGGPQFPPPTCPPMVTSKNTTGLLGLAASTAMTAASPGSGSGVEGTRLRAV